MVPLYSDEDADSVEDDELFGVGVLGGGVGDWPPCSELVMRLRGAPPALLPAAAAAAPAEARALVERWLPGTAGQLVDGAIASWRTESL